MCVVTTPNIEYNAVIAAITRKDKAGVPLLFVSVRGKGREVSQLRRLAACRAAFETPTTGLNGPAPSLR